MSGITSIDTAATGRFVKIKDVRCECYYEYCIYEEDFMRYELILEEETSHGRQRVESC